jgi:hypothetical protein
MQEGTMKDSDRRTTKRFPIRVLVNCLPPGKPRKRNGHAALGWEMWAEDLGDDGVGLRWSLDWANRNYKPDFRKMDERAAYRDPAEPPRQLLKKGCPVVLDGLVYNEKGAKPMRGRIQWSKAAKDGRTYEFGVQITTPDRRSYFRALSA